MREGVILAGAAASTHAKMLPDQRALAPAFDERRALAKRVSAQRALVYTTAITLAGGDPVRRAALDEALGRGRRPAHLASSHAAIVAILREVVADARSRKGPVSVTDAWIDAHARLAANLEQVAEDAAARSKDGEVAQGEVAWWRGVALWFLRQMADQVDAVNAADPRVARLPLGGLKSILRHPPAKKKQKKGAEKKDEAKVDAARKDEPVESDAA